LATETSLNRLQVGPIETEALTVTHPTPPASPRTAILGGCGRAGLPLGIALAEGGHSVTLLDIDVDAVATVNSGRMPFLEESADGRLAAVIANGALTATSDRTSLSSCDNLIVVIGTPVDEHLNPDPSAIPLALDPVLSYLRDGQLMILRSTIYPGVTALVEELLAQSGLDIDVVFCPERTAEGRALVELASLPQIIGGRSEQVQKRGAALFEAFTDKLVFLTPEEAELAKLFTNSWRYVKFATANQLFMMANDFGLDYERIRHAVRWEYPRADDLPSAGFAAGPCLFKDTMQLAAFNNNNFALGHAAMLVNEGLPLYVVSTIERHHDLKSMTVGILGMAFKGNSDDIRSSLAYKLKRILRFKANATLCTDPYVMTDPELVTLNEVLARADLLIIGAPHDAYREIAPDQPLVDIWNLTGNGAAI
jgi:UDP-N-acetyl-D-mannosaminuronic acid dehydrogenase